MNITGSSGLTGHSLSSLVLDLLPVKYSDLFSVTTQMLQQMLQKILRKTGHVSQDLCSVENAARVGVRKMDVGIPVHMWNVLNVERIQKEVWD
jgi:hypothetical protein